MNSDRPKVSIVVPVYNAAAYLHRCVDGLLAQTYRNLEIILVDDGSTDASGSICDSYALGNPTVRTYHIPNGGASLARKFGLQHASGEYVSFADSDDCVDRRYIETLYSLIERYGTDISACNVLRINSDKEIPEHIEGDDSLLAFDELMPRFFKYEFWGLYAKLYKKTVFSSVHFPEATLSEDYFVMSQLFCNERQMAYTSANLYYYEYHDGSLSHLKLSERSFEEFDNVKAVYDAMLSKCPQYAASALSNVVETCIKLLRQIRRENKFPDRAAAMKRFIRQNVCRIIQNRHIYWKIKILAVLNAV